MKADTIVIILVFLAVAFATWMIFFKKAPAYKSGCGCGQQPNQALEFIGGQATNYRFD